MAATADALTASAPGSAGSTVTTAGGAPVARADYFPCLDGLRAIAVLAAVTQHVGYVSAYGNGSSVAARLVRHMEFGPAIFFMLSGFLLYRAYAMSAYDERSPIALREFFRRRALRVLPAYWVALTILLVPAWFGVPHGSPGDVVRLYTLTHVYSERGFFLGMQQSYTLAVEVAFYAMLPVYAWALRRLSAGRDPATRVRFELAGCAVLVVAAAAWRAFVYNTTVLPRVADHWLPGYLDVFALGMATAALHAWKTRTGRRVPVLERLAELPELCAALAVACFLVVTLALDIPFGPVPTCARRLPDIPCVSSTSDQLRTWLQALSAFFLLIPAAFGDQSRGLFRRLLRWKPIVFLGLVSYGVYLWHEGFILHARDGTASGLFSGAFGGQFLPMLIVTLALSTFVASISYEALERPILRLKAPRRALRADTEPGAR